MKPPTTIANTIFLEFTKFGNKKKTNLTNKGIEKEKMQKQRLVATNWKAIIRQLSEN
jgi:hypothetical protein